MTDQEKSNSDWRIDDFVYVKFQSQYGLVEEFGTIINKVHEQYVVRLLNGSIANVYLDAIQQAGRS